MDLKKIVAESSTITRDLNKIDSISGNLYESCTIIANRANQIATEIKSQLSRKLEEFAVHDNSLEEMVENREQIEISRFYERLPKPVLIATEEYIKGHLIAVPIEPKIFKKTRKPRRDDSTNEGVKSNEATEAEKASNTFAQGEISM